MNDFGMLFGGLRLDQTLRETQQPGLTLARVTNINDPNKLNRVICKPIVSDKEKDVLETDWCPVVMPLSGKTCGAFFMPSVGDLVLLAYLNGDPHAPFVIGGTWDGESAAPYTVTDGKNLNYSVKTPGGSELLFFDDKGKERVELRTPKGMKLMMDDDAQTASFADDSAENSVKIDWKNGKLLAAAKSELTISCGSSKITMKSDGTIGIDGKKISINGTDVALEGKTSFKASGNTADVEAKTKLTLKGASTDLKGTAGVNIN